jgi:hypothetical protein
MSEKKEPFSVAISTGSIASVGLIGLGYGVGPLGYTKAEIFTVAPAAHPIYALVGKVASDWAHVEHTLDEIISELAGIEPSKGGAITAQIMGAYGRFKAILALLSLGKPDDRKAKVVARVTELMNKSSNAGEKRNRIVHDPWYTYTTSGKTAQFKSMPHKDHRYGIQAVDSEIVEDALSSIKDFHQRINDLKAEISKLLHGS